jgi:DNA-binding transcriptional LysR family regulator
MIRLTAEGVSPNARAAGGQADVAIRFGHLPDSPLTARRIGATGQVVVASPEYLKRHGSLQEPEDLLRHNCLRFNFRRAEPNWPFIREGREFSLKVSGNIECSSGEALAQLARVGAGIARIGRFSVNEDLQRGDLIPLLEAWNPGDEEPIHALFVGGFQYGRASLAADQFTTLTWPLAWPDACYAISGAVHSSYETSMDP